MAQGKVLGKLGSGLNIDGITAKYIASGNISAGDFVEYIENFGTDTQIISTSNTAAIISAVKLSETKVFIAYSSGGTTDNLYGVVCTISGDTITAGTPVQIAQLYSTNYTDKTFSAVALSENKVFIAYEYGSTTSSRYLHGVVCTISEDTITVGNNTQLSSNTRSGIGISAVVLSEDKIFISHSYGSSYNLYGVVCTISGDTITVGTDTRLSSSSYSGLITSAVVLNANKVFVAHGNSDTSSSLSSSNIIYGVVCTISGDTITAGTDTQIITSNSLMSAVALSESKVFIAYGYNSGSSSTHQYYIHGIVCEISNTTITTGNDTDISKFLNDNYSYFIFVSVTKLDKNRVCIAHNTPVTSSSSTSTFKLRNTICLIVGNGVYIENFDASKLSLNSGYDIEYVSQTPLKNISVVALSHDKIFTGRRYNSRLYGCVNQIKVQKQVLTNNGVAKESVTSGQETDIIAPNYN